MKKVFNLIKLAEALFSQYEGDYLAATISFSRAIKTGWPQDCEGLTPEEMRAKGYGTNESWFIEVED